MMRALGKGKERRPFAIVEGVSGVLKPGSFTLLLGPPGSGKSSFLQTLAGHNRRTPGLKVRGGTARCTLQLIDRQGASP